jgi:hypothetical protein
MDGRDEVTATTRARWAAGTAYAAAAWAFAFAAISFYWAAGGTAGADTIGSTIADPALARDPGMVAILWATGALKALAGALALALALARPWGRRIPRWLPIAACWVGGAFMALYGAANLAVRALMALGLLATPDSMRTPAAQWHLLLWDPWWVLGGLLFVAAAWLSRRRSAEQVPAGEPSARATSPTTR